MVDDQGIVWDDAPISESKDSTSTALLSQDDGIKWDNAPDEQGIKWDDQPSNLTLAPELAQTLQGTPVAPGMPTSVKEVAPMGLNERGQAVLLSPETLYKGIPEAAASTATGIAGFGIGKIYQGLNTLALTIEGHPDPVGAAKKTGEKIAEWMTYQPESASGKELAGFVGGVMNLPFEAVRKGLELTNLPPKIQEAVMEGVLIGTAGIMAAKIATPKLSRSETAARKAIEDSQTREPVPATAAERTTESPAPVEGQKLAPTQEIGVAEKSQLAVGRAEIEAMGAIPPTEAAVRVGEKVDQIVKDRTALEGESDAMRTELEQKYGEQHRTEEKQLVDAYDAALEKLPQGHTTEQARALPESQAWNAHPRDIVEWYNQKVKSGEPLAENVPRGTEPIPEMKEALNEQVIVGNPPKQGFVVANVGSDGKTYYGKPGEIHAHLSIDYPHNIRGDWRKVGFAGPDGKVLTREEALKLLPNIKTSVPGELDAMDYREQGRPTPPSGLPKEPWQISLNDLESQIAKTSSDDLAGRPYKIGDKEIIGRGGYHPRYETMMVKTNEGTKHLKELHKEAVEQAVKEGKPVPAEVLKDYPDLQPPGVKPQGEGLDLGLKGDTLRAPIYETAKTIDDFVDTSAKVGLSTQDVSRMKKANDNIIIPEGTLQSTSQTVEGRFQAAKGITQRGLVEKMKEHIAEAKENIKHTPGLDYKLDAPVINALRRYEAIPQYSQHMAAEVNAGVLAGLGPKKYDIFGRNVILPDLLKDMKLYEGGKELPFGYKNEAELKADINKFKRIADANPDIKVALERRAKFNDILKNELITRDLLPEAVKNDSEYFHHQVLQYMDATRKGLSSSDVRTHTKGWQRGRKGSSLDYNTEYLEAEHQYISQAIAQVKTYDILQEIKKSTDISTKVKADAKQQGIKFEDAIPEGYTTWQPKEGTTWYRTASVPERVVNEVLKGNRDLTVEDINMVLAMGSKRPQWVIPERVAKVLDNFKDFSKDEGFDRFARSTLSTWKQWTLMNPVRVVKYNLNNMSGDLDIALAYNPRILGKFKEASGEAWDHYKGKAASKDMKEAMENGVVSSGFTIQEIPDIKDIGLFKVLTGDTPNIIERFWEKSKGLTQARENILRIAAYKFFKEEIAAGKQVYGASRRNLVDAETNPNKKAAMLARDLIGDYGNISAAGTWLRERMIPFFSWMEINAPRYVRLLQNAPHEGKTAGIAGRVAGVGVKKVVTSTAAFAVKATALYGLVSLWNETAIRMLGIDEDEKRALFSDRRQLHLILGRREDGTIRSLRFQGALSDALDWVGMGSPGATLGDLASGKKSLVETAGDMAISPANKLVNATHPFLKTAGEVMTGKALYPDITKPRPIRDKTEHVARLLSLNIPYAYVTGKPTKGITNELEGLITYRTDTGESAYWMAKKSEYSYLEKRGKEPFSMTPTEKGNALYYWKQARRYGDEDAEEKYATKYFELGGKIESVKDSIARGKPGMSIPEKDKRKFLNSLSGDEARNFKNSQAWYANNMKLTSSDMAKLQTIYYKLKRERRISQ